MNKEDILLYIVSIPIIGIPVYFLLKAVTAEKPSPTPTQPTTPTQTPTQPSTTYKIYTISHTFDLNPFGIPKSFTINNIRIVEITQNGQSVKAFYNSIPIYGRLNSLTIVGNSVKGGTQSYATSTFPDGLYAIIYLKRGGYVIDKKSAKIDRNGVFYFDEAVDITNVEKIELKIGERIGNIVSESPLLVFYSEQSTTDIVAYKLPEITENNISNVMNSQSFRNAAGLYYNCIVQNTSPYSLSFGLSNATLTTYIFDTAIAYATSGYVDINGNDITATSFKLTTTNINGTPIETFAEQYYEKYKKYRKKEFLQVAYALLTAPVYKLYGVDFVGYVWQVAFGPGQNGIYFTHYTKAARPNTFNTLIYGRLTTRDIYSTTTDIFEAAYKLRKEFGGTFALIQAGYKGQYTCGNGNGYAYIYVSPGFDKIIFDNMIPSWYREIVYKYTAYEQFNSSNARIFTTLKTLQLNIHSTQSQSPYCPPYSGNGSLYINGYLQDKIYGSSKVLGIDCKLAQHPNWCDILKALEKYTIQCGPVIPIFNKKSNNLSLGPPPVGLEITFPL